MMKMSIRSLLAMMALYGGRNPFQRSPRLRDSRSAEERQARIRAAGLKRLRRRARNLWELHRQDESLSAFRNWMTAENRYQAALSA